MSKIKELAVKTRSTANDSTYRVDVESNINAGEETSDILSNGWVLCKILRHSVYFAEYLRCPQGRVNINFYTKWQLDYTEFIQSSGSH